MENKILNFSLHVEGLPPGKVEVFTSANPGAVSVDANLSAREASEIALQSGQHVVFVKQQGRLTGFFFPDYVHDLLPEHNLVQGLDLDRDMRLPDMIGRIDNVGIDFHSERINYYPTLRMCPKGHVTSDDPCPRHDVSTEPYP